MHMRWGQEKEGFALEAAALGLAHLFPNCNIKQTGLTTCFSATECAPL